jgi:capsular exopolysaccharide synthesis family protein
MNDVETRSALEGPGLLESMRQYSALAIAIVILFAALGAAVAIAIPKSYSTTAKVGLLDLNTASSTGAARATAGLAEYVTSDDVLATAIKNADKAHASLGVSPTTLRTDCSGTADPNSPTIFVSCSASSTRDATDRTNAVANALHDALTARFNQKWDTLNTEYDKQLASALDLLKSRTITGAQRSAATAEVQSINGSKLGIVAQRANQAGSLGGGVQFITPALVPTKSGTKTIVLQAAIGALVGLIIAMIVCWVLADRRRLVEDAELPARLTGARLLGEVPVLRGQTARALTRFHEMPAPPFGFVAAGLWGSIESGVLMVSGAEHDSGTTTTAASIAAAFARDGRRVVAVDADGRTRGLSKLAGIADGTTGLTDVLTRRAPLEDSLRAMELGDGASVAVLPAGKPEPDLASLLRARSMAETIERLREWYDLVVIDTPPVTSDPEAASLARYSDGMLVVIARNTRLRRLTRLRERLAVLNVAVLGYVFNRDQHAEVAPARTRSATRA